MGGQQFQSDCVIVWFKPVNVPLLCILQYSLSTSDTMPIDHPFLTHPDYPLVLQPTPPPTHYSQTFDHRSSLAFALAAGFWARGAAGAAGSPHGAAEIGAVKLGTAGVSGAAVFHPPKSSSAAILGGEGFGAEKEEVPNPPLPDGDWMLLKPPPAPNPALAAGEFPHPKSPLVVDETDGDLALVCGFGIGGVGSEVAHASFAPHGSAVGTENVLFVGGAEDCTTGW